MNLFYTRPDRSLHLGVFPKPDIVELTIPDAPPFLQGLRALFISDVHLRRRVSDARLNALISRITSCKPDLILLGGDYAEGNDSCLRFFEAFQGISCPLGCYAVPGNNDHDSILTLEKTMADAGVTLLKNACAEVSLNGGRLYIGGCDDHKYGAPDTRNLFPEGEGYRILLSHFPVMPHCRCDLLLSGHTHAGQCNFLGVTPYSIGFERKFRLLGVKGLKKIGNMHLLISSGVGVSRFPFRLGAAPQIYLLNFSQAANC